MLLWLLTALPLSAQQLRFRHLTSEDGLSTNFVSAVMQDDKGFMWFGTQDGLNRYDAYQVKIFKHDPTSKNSLSNSEVSVVKQLNASTLLIGTREGLNFLDLNTEKFTALVSDERAYKKINAICIVDSNTILVGTEEGLFSLDVRTKKVIKHYFSEAVDVRCVEQVNGGTFIGTSGQGLWQLNNGAVQKTGVQLPVPAQGDAAVTAIKSNNNDLYIATYGSGIMKLSLPDLKTEEIISFAALDENANYIRDLIINNNKLYAATAKGLAVYDLNNKRHYLYQKKETPFAIDSDPCNAVFMDHESNLWVGTELGGVNISFFQSLKFPNSHFNYETEFDNIYSFYEPKKDLVLLGSGSLKELNLLNGVSSGFPIAANAMLCIAPENEQLLWVGTWGNGLYRYDAASKTAKQILNDKLGGTIVCLKIDNGFIYAGSVGDGLFRINLKTLEIKQFTTKDGLPDPSINAIFKDSKHNVWLGTYNGGLVKMKDFGTGETLPLEAVYSNKGKDGQIASNAVLAVNEDQKGTIWAATSTGLSKLLPNGTFYNFYEKDGLANAYLYSLLKDSVNNFWMSSNNGLICFNPLLPEKQIIFKNYGVKDGLVNKEYNMGAAFASASGHMYFGGARGFNVFRPTAIKDNPHAPAAYIIGYKRGGKDVITDTLITYKKHLKLSWRENYFQFELAALDYTDPSKNKFKYRLEGYDEDWSAPTSVRYVSYTELPGGEYTFQVLAANNDGVWNEVPCEIKITVVPPFWKTKTFYFLVIIFGMAGVIGFTQYRTRAIKKENKVLENKVAERTKELAEKNHDIMSSIQYAQRIQEAMLPSRELIFKKLKKVFILYKPKDIVSGDFYWFNERNGIKIFAVVDCTGHGVPGAFMSMIGHNLLNQIVLEKGMTDPGDILNNLHKGIQEALRQGRNEINTNDGMDVSLLTINDAEKWVKWAGANRPLTVVNANGELTKYDADKFPVGGAQLDSERIFTTQLIPTDGPCMAYMTSDGYADQFGGEKGKKFMVKRYHDLLMAIHLKPAEEQRSELDTNFEQWKLNHEQVDDVLVVGIEIG